MEKMMLMIIAKLVDKVCAMEAPEREKGDDEDGEKMLGAYASRIVRPWPS